MKKSILVLVLAALISTVVSGTTEGIYHGNSGDNPVAYKGKKEKTFKGNEKKITLKKIQNKIKADMTVKFSDEFEASRTKFFLANIMTHIDFKSKQQMKDFYKALTSGVPVRTALAQNTIYPQTFWDINANTKNKHYAMAQLENAYRGENFLIDLKLEVNPNLNQTCPHCKPEDFIAIPAKGVEFKIMCQFSSSPFGSMGGDIVEVDHEPIIIYPDTKKINRKITIGSPDLAEFFRLRFCDKYDAVQVATQTQCFLTHTTGDTIFDDNHGFSSYELIDTYGAGISSIGYDRKTATFILDKYFTPLLTVDEFLNQNLMMNIKRTSVNKYSLYYEDNKFMWKTVVKYQDEKELDKLIRENFIRAYKRFN